MCNTKTRNGISKLTKIKIFFNKYEDMDEAWN